MGDKLRQRPPLLHRPPPPLHTRDWEIQPCPTSSQLGQNTAHPGELSRPGVQPPGESRQNWVPVHAPPELGCLLHQNASRETASPNPETVVRGPDGFHGDAGRERPKGESRATVRPQRSTQVRGKGVTLGEHVCVLVGLTPSVTGGRARRPGG